MIRTGCFEKWGAPPEERPAGVVEYLFKIKSASVVGGAGGAEGDFYKRQTAFFRADASL